MQRNKCYNNIPDLIDITTVFADKINQIYSRYVFYLYNYIMQFFEILIIIIL